MAAGQDDIRELELAGFSPVEISAHRANISGELNEAGFSEKEVNDYWGQKEPDLAGLKQNFEENIRKRDGAQGTEGTKKPEGQEVQPEAQSRGEPGSFQVDQADSVIDYLESGFDMSVSGLLAGRPDMVMPEDASMFAKLASSAGTLVGDIPAMFAGSVIGGGLAGSAGTVALPVIGTVTGAAIGAGAGAFALPSAMREALMQGYEEGSIKDFEDLWDRTYRIMKEGGKGAIIGAATIGMGGVAGKFLTGASKTVATSAAVATEVTTMTLVGSALNGVAPTAHEFLEAAILVGGMRGVMAAGSPMAKRMATKMRKIYVKTGMRPAKVLEMAERDPHYKQELLSENIEIPGVKTVVGKETVLKTKPKDIKGEPEARSPEIEAISKKIGAKGERIRQGDGGFREYYRKFVDKLDPINEAVKAAEAGGKVLEAQNNPYILSRMIPDAKAKAMHAFEVGTIDFKTRKVNGRPLNKILEGARDLETLEAYMVSKRAIEKSKQGLETGFDLKAAKEVVKNNKAEYEAVAKEVTEFSNNILAYVRDSGLISKVEYKKILELNKDYVSFKRLKENAEGGVSAKASKAGSLKKFKGSELKIQHPIESLVENTIELYHRAEVNNAKVKLVDLVLETAASDITKVKYPAKAITVKASEIAKKTGVSEAALEDITVFAANKRPLTQNQFEVVRNGKIEVYEVNPILAETARALDGDVASTMLAFKLARGVTQFKKHTITFTPDFVARNLMRDMVTASVFSASKGINPWNVAVSMRDLYKKNSHYDRWLQSGGANGAFLELTEGYISKNIRQLQAETGLRNRAVNIVSKPVHWLKVTSNLVEQGVRLSEFKKVTKGRSDVNSLIEGGFASREITLDFQRIGAKMAAMNSITAFQNVAIQGLDKTIRAFEADPIRTSAKAAAYITTPSVLLWWANKDDKRVQELPQWQKDLFWIVPNDDWQDATPEDLAGQPDHMVRVHQGKNQINKGVIWRIPKPMELGVIFGSLPERILDAHFRDEPDAFKNFGETFIKGLTPSVAWDIAVPVAEHAVNKSFFTGQAIVPHNLKGVWPQYQFREYTSQTAKEIGQLVGDHISKSSDFASPMIIENYIRSWTGTLGKYAVQILDRSLEASGIAPEKIRPTAKLSDMPFIRSFVVAYPSAQSKSVEDFYVNLKATRQSMGSIKLLTKRGDIDNLEKEIELKENRRNMVKLDGLAKALSTQRDVIMKITKSMDIDKDEKRQLIDSLYFQMIGVAQAGNDIMKEVRKSVDAEEQ